MKSNELVKLLLATLFALTFIVVVVWLVRSEGERTREALRDASKQAGGEVREGIKAGVTQAVDQVATMPGDVLRDLKDVIVGDQNAGQAGQADAAGGGQQPSGGQPKGAAEQQDPPSALDKAAELPGAVLTEAKDILLGGSRERPANTPPADKPTARPEAAKPAPTRPAEVPTDPAKAGTPKPDTAAGTDEPSAKRTDPGRVNPLDLIGAWSRPGRTSPRRSTKSARRYWGFRPRRSVSWARKSINWWCRT